MTVSEVGPMLFLNASPDDARHRTLKDALDAHLPEVQIVREGDDFDPVQVQDIFTWTPMPDWTVYPNLRTVYSVSAGVDQFTDLPPQVRLIRMVDPKNTLRVKEFVLSACFACLREYPAYAHQQVRREWAPRPAAFIGDTSVGILGLGEIGKVTAASLANVGFEVHGWARHLYQIEDLHCHVGQDGLSDMMRSVDIVVCLLPLTPETRGILNADLFNRMRSGASLVHVGRGAHCNIADLRQALSSGQLSQAVLDVFEVEPLPRDHEGWTLPNTIVTPHVAGRIGPRTATNNIVQNMLRDREGLPLFWEVDRSVGY